MHQATWGSAPHHPQGGASHPLQAGLLLLHGHCDLFGQVTAGSLSCDGNEVHGDRLVRPHGLPGAAQRRARQVRRDGKGAAEGSALPRARARPHQGAQARPSRRVYRPGVGQSHERAQHQVGDHIGRRQARRGSRRGSREAHRDDREGSVDGNALPQQPLGTRVQQRRLHSQPRTAQPRHRGQGRLHQAAGGSHVRRHGVTDDVHEAAMQAGTAGHTVPSVQEQDHRV